MKTKDLNRAMLAIKRALVVLAGLVVGAGLWLGCPPAGAQEPDLTVEIVPQRVELPANRPARIQVVLRNTGAGPLQGIALSWFTDLPVELVEESPTGDTLRPGEAVVWTGALSPAADQPVSGPLHIRVDYRRPGGEGADTVAGVAFGTLQITSPGPVSLDSLVQVSLQSAVDTLTEKRPLVLYLIVNNVSPMPISLLEARPTAPDFIVFQPDRLESEQIIAPGESYSLAFTVRAEGSLVSGDHLLILDVALSWDQDGQTHQRSLLLPKKVTLEPFGEAEILQVLGVPSFYILPGFLMVVTVGLLWRLSKSGREFPFKVTNPEFWLVSITLSILVALIYPRVTGRDYLTGYNLADVVQIWLASIIVAAGSFVVGVGGWNLAGRASQLVQEIRRQRRTPAEDDEPVALLRKLHRQGLGLYLERVELKVEGVADFAFILQPKPEEWEGLWVGPAIVVKWLQGAEVELRQKVAQQLGGDGSALKLARLLAEGRREGDLRVQWRHSPALSRPYLAKREEIVTFEPANLVIEEE